MHRPPFLPPLVLAAALCLAPGRVLAQGQGAAECPAVDSAHANLLGVVRDAFTGLSLAGAEVTLRWDPPGGGREQRAAVVTDARGRFRVCALPADVLILLRPRFHGISTSSRGESFAGGHTNFTELELLGAFSSIRGRVLEEGTGAPVEGARVTLAGTSIESVSAPDGTFLFPQVPEGTLVLELEHLGHAARRDSVRVAHGATVIVTVPLAPRAIALEPIHVVTRINRLERAGFYHRQERGFGRFVTPDDIERLRPTLPSDLLRNTSGVRFHPRYDGPGYVITGGLGCAYSLVVDGVPAVLQQLDDLPASWIQAIEVFPGRAGVPAQYLGALDFDARRLSCGVMLVWTRT